MSVPSFTAIPTDDFKHFEYKPPEAQRAQDLQNVLRLPEGQGQPGLAALAKGHRQAQGSFQAVRVRGRGRREAQPRGRARSAGGCCGCRLQAEKKQARDPVRPDPCRSNLVRGSGDRDQDLRHCALGGDTGKKKQEKKFFSIIKQPDDDKYRPTLKAKIVTSGDYATEVYQVVCERGKEERKVYGLGVHHARSG